MGCRGFFIDAPVPYERGVVLQETVHTLRRLNKLPDTVLFLEHAPVVTLGTRGRDQALLATEDLLRSKGIDLVRASRGGDVTYHAPGQLVIYPVIHLGGNEADAHGYLNSLEEIAIRICAEYGVRAWRRDGMNGAWTGQGKVAAIGFRIRRWVTLHGMSINVDLDLAGFDHIIPCGLTGELVARLSDQADRPVSVPAVRETAARILGEVLNRPLQVEQAPDTDSLLQQLPDVSAD